MLALFDAQLQSRHLDLAARWLQTQGEGFYTIGSAGHEANAALGLLTRVDDPALLHYRSGGFYAARAARNAAERPEAATTPVRDVLLGLSAAAADPISGGRHKVFGHPALHIVPQTSTIASHLPRAVGLAFALGNLADLAPERRWPEDARRRDEPRRRLGQPLDGPGRAQRGGVPHPSRPRPARCWSSSRTTASASAPGRRPGWLEESLRRLPGSSTSRPPRRARTGCSPTSAPRSTTSGTAAARCCCTCGPCASSATPAPTSSSATAPAPRSRATSSCDPLLATAAYLVETGTLTPEDVLDRYERTRVRGHGRGEVGHRRAPPRTRAARWSGRSTDPRPARRRRGGPRPTSPEGRLTLAQAINATLAELLEERPHAVVLGEDVGVKGGVYGVTRGLRKRFGGRRVIDTLLDEQTILGTALGAALAGLLPIPEIQYLAYLHNAEDQLRGEAASLAFFSDGQYRNPMVVRIPGLGYQKGFGGHFHNDNSLAVLRDIPGLVLCVPSHPADAPALIRECVELAELEGRVCVVVEPIALYHSRDLHEPGDGAWTARARRARRPARPAGPRRRDRPARRHLRQRRADVAAGLPVARGRRAPARPSSTCAGSRRCRSTSSRRTPPASAGCWSSTRPGARAAWGRASSAPSSSAGTTAASPGSRAPTPTCRSARPPARCWSPRRRSPRPPARSRSAGSGG